MMQSVIIPKPMIRYQPWDSQYFWQINPIQQKKLAQEKGRDIVIHIEVPFRNFLGEVAYKIKK